jgi:hypothetical protein
VLVHDGKRYDSKAIVGVAHGLLPGERPLASAEFSGGEATVGRLLRGLGFIVQVGDGLVRLLGKLQVYRRDGLPALYQPITLLWAFGRALDDEPRLASWAETRQQVGDLLGRYGRPWERDRVYYPVALRKRRSRQCPRPTSGSAHGPTFSGGTATRYEPSEPLPISSVRGTRGALSFFAAEAAARTLAAPATRGSAREELRPVLLEAAMLKHDEWHASSRS